MTHGVSAWNRHALQCDLAVVLAAPEVISAKAELQWTESWTSGAVV